jgi:small subunit ribosomal protein S19
MSRSSKKGPWVEERLMQRVQAMNESGNKQMVKTWSRTSTIFPDMVGHTIAVHDGRKHVPVFISESMVATSSASSRRRACSAGTPAVTRRRCDERRERREAQRDGAHFS